MANDMQRDEGNQGAVMIEMAIVLSLLIILLAAIVDFSAGVEEQAVMVAAARSAARASASLPATATMVARRDAALLSAKDLISDNLGDISNFSFNVRQREIDDRSGGTYQAIEVAIVRNRLKLFIPGYSHDYRTCVKSMFRIEGNPPAGIPPVMYVEDATC